MRLTPAQSLDGISRNILEVVLPGVSDDYLRGQLQSMATEIIRLRDSWFDYQVRQQQGLEAMESLLVRAQPVLQRAATTVDQPAWSAAADIAAATLAAPPADPTPAALQEREDQLGVALERTLVALEQVAARAPNPEVVALKRDIYLFLRGTTAP